MRYSPIPPKLFVDRRNQFAKQMKSGSIAIFYSNDPMPRSGDTFYPYRQNSTLFSLTGIDQVGTILVLFPDAKKSIHKEIAFILPSDPAYAIWNGERLTHKSATKISEIRTIVSGDHFQGLLNDLIGSATSIYCNSSDPATHITSSSQNERMLSQLTKSFPAHKIDSSQSIMRKLAMIKHPEEISLVKKAVQITAFAFERVLNNVHEGRKEYEVEAELTYILNQHGCQHAFEPIVASGKAACTLHYITNHQVIAKNSLILIDFGAEHANMASDMTRTIPASGRFTNEQKKIYTSVLHVLNETTNMMRPGMTLERLNKEAGKLVEAELIRLKILSRSEVKRQDTKSPLWKKYFMHGVSHHLGFDVHDIAERETPLRAGMIITCEPGIYIPGLNIGIRLENDILITRAGPKNLMSDVPIEPDHIESIMANARDKGGAHRHEPRIIN